MRKHPLANLLYYLLYFCCYLFLFLTVQSVAAQSEYGPTRTTVYSTFVFQSWQLKEADSVKRLTQMALPLFVTRPISPRVRLLISESNAISTLDPIGKSSWPESPGTRIGGIGDTKMKCSYALVPKRLLLMAGISLPTGKKQLTSTELKAFRQFNSESLAFRVGRLGQGFEANLGLAGVQAVGPFTFGYGGSYLARGAYKRLDVSSTKDHKPGNQYNGILSIGVKVRSLHIRTTLSHIRYTPDYYYGVQKFQQGVETVIENRLIYHGIRLSGMAYLRQTIKGDSYLIENSLWSREPNSGRRMAAILYIGYRVTRFITLKTLIENRRRFGGRLAGTESNIFSLGSGLSVQLKRAFSLEISGKLSKGSISSGQVDVTGTCVSSTLTAPF
ncbi:MAG: hypothetical protein QGI86_09570 [Candidatus Poribacteria bacterium]|nr:hypothetical protein [Candidatus Poribacteria bacterium]MDP6750137.1 hypothetical protein [Candidatus Poribacteria bacterium]